MANTSTTALFYVRSRQSMMVFLFFIVVGSVRCIAQITTSDYVTTWKTDNPGITEANQILIPASGEYTVYYESIPAGVVGTLPASGTLTDNQTITLPAAGTYRIAIKPVGATPFHQIFFDGSGDARKLLRVDQWGTTIWSSMENAFRNCLNLTTLPEIDVPNLTNVTTMSRAFSFCPSFVGSSNMNTWNVSGVTDMSYTFSLASVFNQSLGNWNVSNVTNMQNMFDGSAAFDQPLGTWNVGNVTNMTNMFANASSFNKPLSNWDVSKVTNMNGMFNAATLFNQPIGLWNVANVTNTSSMFRLATAFNQSLAAWNVSNVTNMNSMFSQATAFNQSLATWNVANVTAMNSMFSQAIAFNQPLAGWNVGNVTNMQFMFLGATAFNQPLDGWNVSKVTNMQNMFANATTFNQTLGQWSLASFVSLQNMLSASGMDCSNYSTTLVGWAANPATPTGRSLGALDKIYGPYASNARDYLDNTKQWSITGDSFDASCTVLPVTLVSFEVSKYEVSALLTWSTAEETNSERFEIQRSTDGKQWQVISILAASGESKVLKEYRFEDQEPATGLNYYRLKMIDRDQTFAYSHIEHAEFKAPSDFYVFPNPASDKLMIRDYQKVKEISLYNPAGIRILQKTGFSAQGIDISKLSPGIYTVSVTLSNSSYYIGKVQLLK